MPKIEWMLKWSGKLIFSSVYSLLLSILFGLIGIPVLISWATGTLNSLIDTVKSPTPLWATISLTILCCLYLYLKTQPYTPRNQRVKPSKTALDILKLFGHEHPDIRFTAKELSLRFKTTPNQTQFAIDELVDLDFLYAESEYIVGKRKYWLSPEGREFLAKRNLL